MAWPGDLLAVTLLLIAAVGVVVPVLPGVLLAAATVLGWAILSGGTAWWFATAALLVLAVGKVVKYLLPGRRLADAGVPARSLVIAGGAGIVGFFAIPVVGLPVGFVAGAYLAEWHRLRDAAAAGRSTRHALTAVGWSILIELASVLLATGLVIAGSAAT